MPKMISQSAIREIFNLHKSTIYLKDGAIHWKRTNVVNKPSKMFEFLSDKNKNRVLYYAATLHRFLQDKLPTSQIEELLNMDNHFDTSIERNVLAVVSKISTTSPMHILPLSPFISLIVDIPADEIEAAVTNSLKGRLDQYTAVQVFLNYALLLVIDMEYEGQFDLISSYYTELKDATVDEIVMTSFIRAGLPEPTIDYLATGEARFM